MSESGNGFPRRERRPISDAVAARRRAQMVSGLRGLKTGPPGGARPGNGAAADGDGNGNRREDPGAERCDLCSTTIPDDHRHMLNIEERRIVCT